MTKHFAKLALVVVPALALGASVRAQEAPKGPLQLKVTVVISKYQGDKKISSLPYMLSVNSNNARASLRMGGQVPIASTSYTPIAAADGKMQAPLQSFSYKDVGTSIDVSANAIDDTRFKIDLTIEDSSVYTEGVQGTTLRAGDHPSFRSFRSNNTLILKDGQSLQYTTGTDKISGEVVKVDVTLNIVK